MLRRLLGIAAMAMLCFGTSAWAQRGGPHAHGTWYHANQGLGRNIVPSTMGGAGFGFFYPYYVMGTPGGVIPFAPGPVGFGPAWGGGGLAFGPTAPGPVAPPPPPGWLAPARVDQVGKKPTRKDAARSGQLVVLGDRLFRGNNTKRAEERYLQAARLDPSSASPLIHLTQIALVRDQYTEAAIRLREAETAQPGWLVTAPDVQSLYAEPEDFARRLSRLESHLQVHPDDRDAWLVLGAEWYLSGRSARAADVFQRLNDPARRPDIALAAFLEATTQKHPRGDQSERSEAGPDRAHGLSKEGP
ncbi:MAG: tetratricopeptide repeat protein [Isosphaeraceae bacterium]